MQYNSVLLINSSSFESQSYLSKPIKGNRKAGERHINTHQRFCLRMKICNKITKVIQLLKIQNNYSELRIVPKVYLISFIFLKVRIGFIYLF